MKREIINEVLFFCALQLVAFCILPLAVITPDSIRVVQVIIWIVAIAAFIGVSLYIWFEFIFTLKDIKKKYEQYKRK